MHNFCEAQTACGGCYIIPQIPERALDEPYVDVPGVDALQAVEHAQHTIKRPGGEPGLLPVHAFIG